MKKRQRNIHSERKKISPVAVYSLSFFCIIAVWKFAAVAVHAPLVLPSPEETFLCLASLCRTSLFWHHIGATVLRVFYAFFLTLLLGTILGVVCGVSSFFRRFFEFPLTIIRSTPVVSFILLALFWFGSSFVPVFVAFLMTLPVMATSVSSGFSQIDKKLVDMAKVYRLSRAQRFKYLVVPSVEPFLIDGALSSFGLSWKVVAAGEVLSLPKWGSGELLQIAQVHLETQEVMAVTVAVVALSFALEKIAQLAVKKIRKQAEENHRKNIATDILSWNRNNKASANLNNIYFSDVKNYPPSQIVIRNLSVTRGGKELYKNFSLEISAGSKVAFIAPSGDGKTTLLDCIAGLINFDDVKSASGTFSGSITSSNRVSYLFQEPRLIPGCTVLQNILIPLENVMTHKNAFETAIAYAEAAGLADRKTAYPEELSGGEKQRASLARACAFPSEVLLMDEAFQSQDIKQKSSLMQILISLLAIRPRTLILVTHDIREAVSLCERILILSGTPMKISFDEQNTPCEDNEEVVSRFIAKIRSL